MRSFSEIIVIILIPVFQRSLITVHFAFPLQYLLRGS